jgi:hypothetical protein
MKIFYAFCKHKKFFVNIFFLGWDNHNFLITQGNQERLLNGYQGPLKFNNPPYASQVSIFNPPDHISIARTLISLQWPDCTLSHPNGLF